MKNPLEKLFGDLFSKRKAMRFTRALGHGRAVSCSFEADVLSEGDVILGFQRKIVKADVSDGKLLPADRYIIRRGGKTELVVRLNPDAAEALYQTLRVARKEMRRRRFLNALFFGILSYCSEMAKSHPLPRNM